MTTTLRASTGLAAQDAAATRTGFLAPRSNVAYDATMAFLVLWLVGGLFLDGWAHNHRPDLETFFTPWHAVLYSGFFAVALFTGATWLRNRRAAASWREAVPPGYALTLAGVGVFFVAGFADMVWHEVFGIESSVEALLSPSHLFLATAFVLMAAGPLRAYWARRRAERPAGFARKLPMLVSAGLVLSLLGFFTQFVHPFTRPWMAAGNAPVEDVFALEAANPLVVSASGGVGAVDVAHAMGIAGIVIQSAFVVGVLLLLLRRDSLPVGGITVILGLSGVFAGTMRSQFLAIPVALAVGILADVLLHVLEPTMARPRALRVFAAAVPVLLSTAYLVAQALTGSVWWSVHALGGFVVLGGLAGYFLAYLVTSRAPMEVARARVP